MIDVQGRARPAQHAGRITMANALYGTTTPFGAAELTARYPTHGTYVGQPRFRGAGGTIRP